MPASRIPFQLTGLTIVPALFASVIVYLFGGPIADRIALRLTRLLGRGHREPEYNLPNLVLPFLCGIAGCAIFGVASQNSLHYTVLLVGSFLLTTGSLTSLSLINTFIIESYPQWAGPVLVTVSSLRVFISFFFSSRIMAWIQTRGPLVVFVAFAVMLVVVALGIPVLFVTGKRLREWTSGRVARRELVVVETTMVAPLPPLQPSATPSLPSGAGRVPEPDSKTLSRQTTESTEVILGKH